MGLENSIYQSQKGAIQFSVKPGLCVEWGGVSVVLWVPKTMSCCPVRVQGLYLHHPVVREMPGRN